MLAPARPVAPVTRTVSLIPRAARPAESARAVSTWSGSNAMTGGSVPKGSSVWMKRWVPMEVAQVKPNSMICAAVKTSPRRR